MSHEEQQEPPCHRVHGRSVLSSYRRDIMAVSEGFDCSPISSQMQAGEMRVLPYVRL